MKESLMETKKLRRWDVVGPAKLEMVSFLPSELTVGDDELLLEFETNGQCGSDVHMYNTGAKHPGHAGCHKPLTLGHELIARVKARGKNVTSHNVGDLVSVEPGKPCGTCPNCKKKRYHCCPATLYMGTPPQNGGLADEFVWPAEWCHALPAELVNDPILASLAEPLAACRQSVVLRDRTVTPEADEWTVVVGSGAMALGVVAIIKAMHPEEKVIVVARNEQALAFAKEFGADATVRLSDVDPKRVAMQVTLALKELFTTDHFDNDDVALSAFTHNPVLLAAARAAREAVNKNRLGGEHQEELEVTLYNAALATAIKAQIDENKEVFKKVKEMAGGFVSSVFECTGDGRLLEVMIGAQFMLANAALIGLGCHYGVSFDVAHLRRHETNFQPVRRSAHQFGPTLELLRNKPDLFRKLVGGTVPFAKFGDFMKGDTSVVTPTGTGGPKMVIVK